MMYGFGDDENPYTESVDILEDLVIDFITDMVCIYLYVLSFYSVWFTLYFDHCRHIVLWKLDDLDEFR